jgi:hypothetical protein
VSSSGAGGGGWEGGGVDQYTDLALWGTGAGGAKSFSCKFKLKYPVRPSYTEPPLVNDSLAVPLLWLSALLHPLALSCGYKCLAMRCRHAFMQAVPLCERLSTEKDCP